jgi:hypothetical protein
MCHLLLTCFSCSRAILRAVALTKLEDADESDSSQIVKQVSIDNCNIGLLPNVFNLNLLSLIKFPPSLPFALPQQEP